MTKILSVVGTRPEAIKMAPIIWELNRHQDRVTSCVCATGQHREMLDQALNLFHITPDYDLNVMHEGASLTQIAAAVLTRLEAVLSAERPDWVLVQGDTTTTAASSLAAFYHGAKVGHVEAGLRTYDKYRPFPEEVNRCVAGVVAHMHFAPTAQGRSNLLREGVAEDRVVVTGNPVIDTLRWAAIQTLSDRTLDLWTDMGLSNSCMRQTDASPLGLSSGGECRHDVILVTAHRRENFGAPLERICSALRRIASHYNGRLRIIYPVHPNPSVSEPVQRLLGDSTGIMLIPPLDYLSLIHLMKRCSLVLTDSGGIQEEAPALGKPVLVLRDITERPEAVQAGTVLMVGTEEDCIVGATLRLLDDETAYERMAQSVNPYGDGHAAERIVAALLGDPLAPFVPASR